jgi:hypothetical protein
MGNESCRGRHGLSTGSPTYPVERPRPNAVAGGPRRLGALLTPGSRRFVRRRPCCTWRAAWGTPAHTSYKRRCCVPTAWDRINTGLAGACLYAATRSSLQAPDHASSGAACRDRTPPSCKIRDIMIWASLPNPRDTSESAIVGKMPQCTCCACLDLTAGPLASATACVEGAVTRHGHPRHSRPSNHVNIGRATSRGSCV